MFTFECSQSADCRNIACNKNRHLGCACHAESCTEPAACTVRGTSRYLIPKTVLLPVHSVACMHKAGMQLLAFGHLAVMQCKSSEHFLSSIQHNTSTVMYSVTPVMQSMTVVQHSMTVSGLSMYPPPQQTMTVSGFSMYPPPQHSMTASGFSMYPPPQHSRTAVQHSMSL